MICDRCSSHMELQYEVQERYNHFTLWACSCGKKFLERERAATLHVAPRVEMNEMSEQQVF